MSPSITYFLSRLLRRLGLKAPDLPHPFGAVSSKAKVEIKIAICRAGEDVWREVKARRIRWLPYS